MSRFSPPALSQRAAARGGGATLCRGPALSHRGPAPSLYFRFRRHRRRTGRRGAGGGLKAPAMLRSLRPIPQLCPRLCPPGPCPARCQPRRRLAVPPGAPLLPLWQRLCVAGAVAGAAAAGWLYVRHEKERQQRSRRLQQLRRLALGQGDFQLRDTAGAARSKADFLGRWVLLYFGFTHCPDVCPEELEKLSRAVELLERDPALPPLQPLFVTVDPERDDAAALERYLRDFHPRLLGLTGTPEQVRAAASAFRVYVSAGPRDADGDYVVDHSVLTFLVDPDGVFRDCYGRSRTAEEVARSVKGHMDAYEPLPPADGQ
ncbi:protein SCO2 homolog, mitochondrial [Zonotrichia leucophrys gambelii]|uniref:protein SCO2 homolog, mitochondrial n=1 Tax=Zonotrichia leucophrys gambelii TaxID=257770 RepID=UPI0031408D8A